MRFDRSGEDFSIVEEVGTTRVMSPVTLAEDNLPYRLNDLHVPYVTWETFYPLLILFFSIFQKPLTIITMKLNVLDYTCKHTNHHSKWC